MCVPITDKVRQRATRNESERGGGFDATARAEKHQNEGGRRRKITLRDCLAPTTTNKQTETSRKTTINLGTEHHDPQKKRREQQVLAAREGARHAATSLHLSSAQLT